MLIVGLGHSNEMQFSWIWMPMVMFVHASMHMNEFDISAHNLSSGKLKFNLDNKINVFRSISYGQN